MSDAAYAITVGVVDCDVDGQISMLQRCGLAVLQRIDGTLYLIGTRLASQYLLRRTPIASFNRYLRVRQERRTDRMSNADR